MSAPFASDAWIDQWADALRSSDAVRDAATTWVYGPVAFDIDGDAEHGVEPTTLELDVTAGGVRGVRRIDRSDLRLTPFVVGGPFTRWKGVFSGSLPVVDGVRDARLRSSGDLPTIWRHAGLFDAIAAAGSSVATSWQDDAVEAGAGATA